MVRRLFYTVLRELSFVDLYSFVSDKSWWQCSAWESLTVYKVTIIGEIKIFRSWTNISSLCLVRRPTLGFWWRFGRNSKFQWTEVTSSSYWVEIDFATFGDGCVCVCLVVRRYTPRGRTFCRLFMYHLQRFNNVSMILQRYSNITDVRRPPSCGSTFCHVWFAYCHLSLYTSIDGARIRLLH